MFKAGDQVPVYPLLDVIGKADKASPLQMSATALNVGVIGWLTFIVKVVVAAH